MTFFNYFYFLPILTILILSIVSTLEDIFTRKIKNKTILIFLSISTILYFLRFIITKDLDFVKYSIVNIIISILITFYLYYNEYLGAGDSKLIIIYTILFSTFIKDYFIFLYLPFIFLSFYLTVLIRGFLRLNKSVLKELKNSISLKEIVITFVVSFGITILKDIVFKKFNIFNVAQNVILLFIFYILLIKFTFKIIKKKFKSNFKLWGFLILVIAIKIYIGIDKSDFYFAIFYTFIRIIIFRTFNRLIELTSYKKVLVNKLKPGMLVFNVKEKEKKPKKRLTNFEINIIKNQKKTKYFYVHSELPFTIFISIGNLILIFLYIML